VARSARHAAEARNLLDALARADVDRASYGESLSVPSLRALPLDRRRNALRFWIGRAGYLAPDTRRLEEIAGPLLAARPDANPFVEWGARDTRDLAAQWGQAGRAGGAVGGPTGTTISGPRQSKGAGAARGVRAQRHGDLLSLHASAVARAGTSRVAPGPRPPWPANADADTTSHAPSVTRNQSDSRATPLTWFWRKSPRFDLPDDLGSLEIVPDSHGPIDLDRLPEPVTVGQRAGGERLTPRRGGPRRALKSLLQEAHVSVVERARLPLLFSGTGRPTAGQAKLIAVADLLLDESVQATAAARHRARLRWKKSSHSH
jgi:tRNA(Ile)-lysidine synthetase-like protein